jgi:hypothetical protein
MDNEVNRLIGLPQFGRRYGLDLRASHTDKKDSPCELHPHEVWELGVPWLEQHRCHSLFRTICRRI